MSLDELTGRSAKAGHGSVPTPALVAATIATTPAGREDIEVTMGGTLRTGPCRWTPVVIDGEMFTPARGDPCFVQQARRGEMVVVWWEPGDDREGSTVGLGGPAGPAGAAGATGATGPTGPAGATPETALVTARSWRLDESSGAALADAMGGSALTVSGGVTLQAEAVPSIVTVGGVAAQSVEFNGSNGHAQSSIAPSGLVGYGFYVGCWIRMLGASTTGVPLAYGTALNGWALLFTGSAWSMYRAGVGLVGTSSANYVVDQWYRLGVWCPPVGGSAAICVYIDGALVLTCSPFALTDDANDLLCLGSVGGGANWSNCRVLRVRVIRASTAGAAGLVARSDYMSQFAAVEF